MTAKLGVQLYSVREAAASNWERTIDRVAAMGYVGVEPAGLYGMPPERFYQLIADAGMVICSAHVPMLVGAVAAPALDELEAMGATTAFTNLPPAAFVTGDDVRRSADQLNEATRNANARGIRFGYHNHDAEFNNRIGSQSAYDMLVELLDPGVALEVDIYQVGARAPATVIRGLGDRVRYLHVKDGPLDNALPQVAVGAGKVSIPEALRANPKILWHVVELDTCGTDMFAALEQSARYLLDLGLTEGVR